MHEFVFTEYDTEHCSTTEYVQELNAPTHHGDICDIHFEYHQTYIVADNNVTLPNIQKPSELILEKRTYNFLTTLNFIIPPIV